MKQAGLTLIEILISIAISVVVGGLLVVIIVNSANLFFHESSKLTEGLNTNDALSKVRETIKQSIAVAASYSTGGTTYTSSAQQAVFKLASVDSSNNIILNTFDYAVFYINGNLLRYKVYPEVQSARSSQNQVLSTLAESINFEYLNSATPPQLVTPTSATKVRMTLTLKEKHGISFEKKIATTEADLRND